MSDLAIGNLLLGDPYDACDRIPALKVRRRQWLEPRWLADAR